VLVSWLSKHRNGAGLIAGVIVIVVEHFSHFNKGWISEFLPVVVFAVVANLKYKGGFKG
jgi:hypothetical protein